MKKIFRLNLLVLATAIIFQSCQKPVDVIIDNPTEDNLAFELDGVKLSIKPLRSIPYKSYEGDHKINVGGKEKEFKLNAARHQNALINPTESTYILKEFLFKLDGDSIVLSKLNNIRRNRNRQRSVLDQLLLIDTIDIAGVEVVGLYAKESDIVIRKRWDFTMDETVPDAVYHEYPSVMADNLTVLKATELINGHQGKVKIYRQPELLGEMLREYRISKNRK